MFSNVFAVIPQIKTFFDLKYIEIVYYLQNLYHFFYISNVHIHFLLVHKKIVEVDKK